MNRPPVYIRPGILSKFWVAICRECAWYHSYPTQAVAIHAATQHVIHFLRKEKEKALRAPIRIMKNRTDTSWRASCRACYWVRVRLTWKEVIGLALEHHGTCEER